MILLRCPGYQIIAGTSHLQGTTQQIRSYSKACSSASCKGLIIGQDDGHSISALAAALFPSFITDDYYTVFPDDDVSLCYWNHVTSRYLLMIKKRQRHLAPSQFYCGESLNPVNPPANLIYVIPIGQGLGEKTKPIRPLRVASASTNI